jgi:hypothetical protein
VLALAAHPLRVGGKRRLVDLLAHREEEVEADRPLGERVELCQLGLDVRGALVARSEKSETPGLGDRGGKLGRRRAACERRADDRDVEQTAYRISGANSMLIWPSATSRS